ncbi:hypothetical protein AURDEDRAFT_167142 [Auricularia subglabra TFB-10046 SS5]|nr:hypothetical protein AURDEDRAFT_167142 [Auricularia subglabra TFB-10046 SS5]
MDGLDSSTSHVVVHDWADERHPQLVYDLLALCRRPLPVLPAKTLAMEPIVGNAGPSRSAITLPSSHTPPSHTPPATSMPVDGSDCEILEGVRADPEFWDMWFHSLHTS